MTPIVTYTDLVSYKIHSYDPAVEADNEAREVLGKNIRRQRRLSRISQEKAAELSHMERPMFARIERGRWNPTFETMLRIARALKVPLTALVVDIE